MAVETNNRCVQRVSKVSESAVQNGFGIVPSVSDGPAQTVSRMSKMAVETNNRCVQRVSKVSESAVQNGFGIVPSVSDGPAQAVSNMSKMSSVVAPSVSDGPAQAVSNMSRMFEKTNNRCAQRHSKLSESDGCPVCYTDRMGYVQEHSNVSESGKREVRRQESAFDCGVRSFINMKRKIKDKSKKIKV